VWYGLVLSNCTYQAPNTPNQEPLLVATTTLSADVLRHVAWKGANVQSLMGPGTDPHLFKPSLADVRLLANADLILAGGLHLEGKMSDVLHKLEKEKAILNVSDSVPRTLLRFAPGSTASADPHIWFNVNIWQLGVGGVGHRLAKLYPAHAAEILARTKSYQDSLSDLHQWVLKETNHIPLKKRILVTSHDAFSYFGTAYGFQVKTLQGISTLSDFGLRDVSDLVQFLVKKEVPILYPETSMPPQTLDAIQEACARAGHKISLGSELYTDALDAPTSPAGTYIGMIRYNVTTILHAKPHTNR